MPFTGAVTIANDGCAIRVYRNPHLGEVNG